MLRLAGGISVVIIFKYAKLAHQTLNKCLKLYKRHLFLTR